MNNLEENLKQIKLKNISAEEKNSLWSKIIFRRLNEEKYSSQPFIYRVSFSMRKMAVGFFALILILSGSIVASSKNSMPGEILFPIDVAVDKIEISLAGEEKRNELRFKFAEDQIQKIKNVSKEKSIPPVLITDLSQAEMLEMEAVAYSNETVVSIETKEEVYGYLSTLKSKDEIIKEIAEKYVIPVEKVDSLILFAEEQRESTESDKEFLNKTVSIEFSEKEINDISKALTDLEAMIENSNQAAEQAEKIEKAFTELLILLGDQADLEIKKTDGEITIKKEDVAKIKTKFESQYKPKEGELQAEQKVEESKPAPEVQSLEAVLEIAPEEDASLEKAKVEIFCGGEWREESACYVYDPVKEDVPKDPTDKEEKLLPDEPLDTETQTREPIIVE
jgi:hypothetical protein